jgi:hypothetical protein
MLTLILVPNLYLILIQILFYFSFDSKLNFSSNPKFNLRSVCNQNTKLNRVYDSNPNISVR